MTGTRQEDEITPTEMREEVVPILTLGMGQSERLGTGMPERTEALTSETVREGMAGTEVVVGTAIEMMDVTIATGIMAEMIATGTPVETIATEMIQEILEDMMGEEMAAETTTTLTIGEQKGVTQVAMVIAIHALSPTNSPSLISEPRTK
jgi:hypothetical protein